jgi:threonine dehydrogenase-like Zn-dependent dehydrogenase
MRAARYYGIEDIKVEEIEEPVCGADQLKIKPAFVGICGTDLYKYLRDKYEILPGRLTTLKTYRPYICPSKTSPAH